MLTHLFQQVAVTTGPEAEGGVAPQAEGDGQHHARRPAREVALPRPSAGRQVPALRLPGHAHLLAHAAHHLREQEQGGDQGVCWSVCSHYPIIVIANEDIRKKKRI